MSKTTTLLRSSQGPTLRLNPMDFEALWGNVAHNIRLVLNEPRIPPPTSFPTLDRAVYKLATADDCTSIPTIEEVEGRLAMLKEPTAKRFLIIHALLTRIISSHLKSAVLLRIRSQARANLLVTVVNEFDTFSLSMRLITVMFRYLRFRARELRGVESLHDIIGHGFQIWREVVFNEIDGAFVNEIQNIIAADRRDGIPASPSLLRRALTSLIAISDDPHSPLKMYRSKFEQPFLADVQRYYVGQQARLQRLPDLSAYNTEAERLISLELKRVSDFIDRSTQPLLTKLLLQCLIDSRLDEELEQFAVWIQLQSGQDLHRLFRLMFYSEKGLDPLRKAFEDQIDADGCDEVQKVLPAVSKDPAALMQCIFQVCSKYESIVSAVFDNNLQMRKAFDQGAKRFINRNAVYPHNTAKAAESLAKYCNILLKSNSREVVDEPIEEYLAKVMRVFKLLEDKDVFFQFYGSLLAVRLIYGSSDCDTESLMIMKLKEECGHEYTYKFQNMLADVTAHAKQTREGFHDDCAKTPEGKAHCFFCPVVLMHGSWPITVPTEPAVPLKHIASAFDAFNAYFSSIHQCRKLTWVPQFAYGTIVSAVPFKGKWYEFLVSHFQLAVLLTLDLPGEKPVSRAVIMNAANESNPANTDKALGILLRIKLVNEFTSPKSDGAAKTFALNPEFSYPARKINLLAPREGSKGAAAGGGGKDDEGDVGVSGLVIERKHAIQAAIVRVMKSRRTLQHSQLVSEVGRVLSHKFAASTQDIKSNIDVLIEKDYLERSADDRSTYIYVT